MIKIPRHKREDRYWKTNAVNVSWFTNKKGRLTINYNCSMCGRTFSNRSSALYCCHQEKIEKTELGRLPSPRSYP